MLGAPADDLHGLATALVADLLRGRGFSVADLGANTPAASFVETIAGAPRLVGVGVVVSTPVDDALVAATIATIKAITIGPVVLGGVAIRDEAHAVRSVPTSGRRPPARQSTTSTPRHDVQGRATPMERLGNAHVCGPFASRISPCVTWRVDPLSFPFDALRRVRSRRLRPTSNNKP